MSIRKRKWRSGGETKEAWVVDYFDRDGVRRQESFRTKKEAIIRRDEIGVDLRKGIHTAARASITVAQACDNWLVWCAERPDHDGGPVERSTLDQRKGHVRLHIKRYPIATVKLSKLTPKIARDWLAQLAVEGMLLSTRRKVLTSFKAAMKLAHNENRVAHNPVRDVSITERKRAKTVNGKVEKALHLGQRDRGEIRALLKAANEMRGVWRPYFVTAIFTGMRASELRGLRWQDLELNKAVIHVTQRIDAWGQADAPKSEAGTRDIPLPNIVTNTLKTWRNDDKRPASDLVFPNGNGKPESYANMYKRAYVPMMRAAGVVVPAINDETGEPITDEEGSVILVPKYPFHELRHAAAALFHDAGFQPKRLQEVMGHATLAMTMDTYAYLFENTEGDAAALAEMERRLLA